MIGECTESPEFSQVVLYDKALRFWAHMFHVNPCCGSTQLKQRGVFSPTLTLRIYFDGVSHSINAMHGPSWVMIFDSTEAADGYVRASFDEWEICDI